MNSFVAKLVREPALALGVITAGLSLAVLFGADITTDQMAGVGIFISALFALTRYLTTPVGEVVAQDRDGKIIGGAKAGPLKGQYVDVGLSPAGPPGDVDPNPPVA